MKSHRKQYRECRSKGILLEGKKDDFPGVKFNYPFNPEIVLYCSKFKKQCKSSTCRNMRERLID